MGTGAAGCERHVPADTRPPSAIAEHADFTGVNIVSPARGYRTLQPGDIQWVKISENWDSTFPCRLKLSG